MERIDVLKANEYKFWNRVKKDKTDLCWLWMKYKDKDGYGDFQFRYLGKKYNFKSHRVSYELINGIIPSDLIICHKCDNPTCVNPNHLFIGTHKDNCDDKVNKGRQALAENNGRSKLKWDDVYKIKLHTITDINELSKKYSVDKKTIRCILSGTTWK